MPRDHGHPPRRVCVDGPRGRRASMGSSTSPTATTGSSTSTPRPAMPRRQADARPRRSPLAPATPGSSRRPRRPGLDSSAGDLYVANAGGAGRDLRGRPEQPHGGQDHRDQFEQPRLTIGTGLVQSIGLSPDGKEVLAVLDGLSFPGDVMATINPSTQAITSTVSLETGTDAMGQLVGDGSLDYVWVTDATSGKDVIQNLNLAVTDPASQPYVTAVGGTSLGRSARRSRPGTMRSTTPRAQAMAASRRPSPCRRTSRPSARSVAAAAFPARRRSGDCREIPDVSADADPSSGLYRLRHCRRIQQR